MHSTGLQQTLRWPITQQKTTTRRKEIRPIDQWGNMSDERKAIMNITKKERHTHETNELDAGLITKQNKKNKLVRGHSCWGPQLLQTQVCPNFYELQASANTPKIVTLLRASEQTHCCTSIDLQCVRKISVYSLLMQTTIGSFGGDTSGIKQDWLLCL